MSGNDDRNMRRAADALVRIADALERLTAPKPEQAPQPTTTPDGDESSWG